MKKAVEDIRRLRIEKKATQAEASAFCGVPLRTWEAWERGLSQPPQYTINLIYEKLLTIRQE